MGVTDNYTNETGFGPGPAELTILEVKFVTGKNTGTDGIELKYCRCESIDHPVNKTLWQGKFFNKNLTSWILGLGLNPADLAEASKAGRGDDWLLSKLPGRHGIFDFCPTDRINERSGRPYLEPKCRAEVELAEWIASQPGNSSGVRPSQNPHRDEPPIDSYQNPVYTDDVPY